MNIVPPLFAYVVIIHPVPIVIVVVVDITPSFFGIRPIDIFRFSSLSLSATAYFIRFTRSMSVCGVQLKLLVAAKNIHIIAITIIISKIVKPYFSILYMSYCLFIENFYYSERFYPFFLIFNMKYIFTLLISVAIFVAAPVFLFAASGDMTSANGFSENSTLSLDSISVVDDLHVNVTFSEMVDISTLKLKLTKQSDNSNIKLASLTGSLEGQNDIIITLESELQEGSAYTLTVISAIGENGSVITDGALALRDFITPMPLKKYEVVLNAPSNPNAVQISTGTTESLSSSGKLPSGQVQATT